MKEEELRQNGYALIAGVDEAGRGPLAGPVVAAAVILPAKIEPHILAGIRDSKQLTESSRAHFYEVITEIAEGYAVGHASAREIETVNIRQASLLAMKRAVERLRLQPDFVLVDGRDYPAISLPGQAIIRGDQTSVTVGAASIVAKVVRDRIMTALHARYPQYGFDQHKGYPTAFHRLAVEIFGACDLHRATFAGVTEHILSPELSNTFLSQIRQIGKCRQLEDIETFLHHLTDASLPLSAKERSYLEHRAQLHRDFLSRLERIKHPTAVDVGAELESLAIDYLHRKGYVLWERNFRRKGGEIDLIMNRSSQIVFVEVKSRSTAKFGMPYEAASKKKMKSVFQTADRYLHERGLTEGWDIRYDVISILAETGASPQIEHFEDAYRSDDFML